MKTKEELCALRSEVEALSSKLSELSEEELKQVVGGYSMKQKILPQNLDLDEIVFASAADAVKDIRPSGIPLEMGFKTE